MKFQPDVINTAVINGYGPGWVSISGEKVLRSVVLNSNGVRQDWHCDSFAELSAAHFQTLATLKVEVVLFGSGQRMRFAPLAWLKPLIDAGIGMETMDTAAACRTYNILAGEGRSVAAALLIETTEG